MFSDIKVRIKTLKRNKNAQLEVSKYFETFCIKKYLKKIETMCEI